MYTAGRFGPVRRCAVKWNSVRARPDRLASSESPDLCHFPVEEAARRLAADGICTGLKLTPEALREVLEYCETFPCFGDGDRARPFFIADRPQAEERSNSRFMVARYLDARQNCPTLIRLERDPQLRAIAREYFGCEPALVGARIWWSFAADATPNRRAESGQTFHYDIDGYRSVSFFFYLTNVDDAGGAHICVRGSHNQKSLAHLVSLHKSRTDEDIEASYPADRFQLIAGNPGDGFAEDTFCFHKGKSPRERDRLVLQVRFGLRDYGTGEGAG